MLMSTYWHVPGLICFYRICHWDDLGVEPSTQINHMLGFQLSVNFSSFFHMAHDMGSRRTPQHMSVALGLKQQGSVVLACSLGLYETSNHLPEACGLAT